MGKNTIWEADRSGNKSQLLGLFGVAQWKRTQPGPGIDVGSIPGLHQWVKDPALQWAVVWVTEAVQI